MLTKLLKQTAQLLLPYCCLLCESTCQQPYLICQDCETLLLDQQTRCIQCGYPCATQYCGQCLKHPPAFDNTITFGSYAGPLRLLLSQLKFYERLAVAKTIGTLMANQLKNAEAPECLIPIPLHRKRLRQRGYNQALEIAKMLKQQLKIPLNHTSCRRHKATAAQATLPAKFRRKNVHDAFSIISPLPYRHVAIIDDVITTGETANAFAKQLKKQGIQQIQLWCAARTGPD